MTKLACSFTRHVGLCDSKIGGFLVPRPAPSTPYPEGTLLVAQTQHPGGQGSGKCCPLSVHSADKELESNKNHHR